MRRKRQGDETYDDYDDYGSYETTTAGGNSYDILIFSIRFSMCYQTTSRYGFDE